MPRTEYARAYYKANRAKVLAQQRTYYARIKEDKRKYRARPEVKARIHKWREGHYKQIQETRRKYRLAHLQQYREYRRQWRKKFPEKEKERRQRRHRYSIRFDIFVRDHFSCVYCGRNVREDNIKLEMDHVIPRSKGGTNSMNNLVTSCRDCNIGKRNKLINP